MCNLDGHYQVLKHVVVPYVENTLYSTNKYNYVRPGHTLYINYFIEHNGDDEPHETLLSLGYNAGWAPYSLTVATETQITASAGI